MRSALDMRTALFVAAGFMAGLSATPALADDSAACDAGIRMIESEQANGHPKATADALKTALRVARREKGEQEYDECLDAISDAEKALKK
jgi:hypothetical protein